MPDRPQRVCVLFHESELLGAGVSALRALEELRLLGWAAAGWFPGPGRLLELSEPVLDAVASEEKPIAFSLRELRRDPGPLARMRRTPGYLRAFDRWLSTQAPDVVHANSLLMLPEAAIARRRGLPIVVQVHEIRPPGPKRNLAVRWASAVADVLIGVSEPVSQMLRRQAGRTPVRTVHNGIPAVDRPATPDSRFVVGTIGHISRTKGTDVFLEAARLALSERPDLRFEHVGPARLWGDDAFDAEVERLATAPVLCDALRMLGHSPASAALGRWSLFVLSSRLDAFPLSTLEAMAAGVPVVASAVGGIPEQIEHLRTGILVPAEDAAVLSEWIVRLHDDSDLRSRLAASARDHVMRTFTLRAQAEGLGSAYEEAIRRRAGSGRAGPRNLR
jgi:glycosyltransferase involved in cell wall biosynthesis